MNVIHLIQKGPKLVPNAERQSVATDKASGSPTTPTSGAPKPWVNEGIKGIEFPVDGRFIDILAVDVNKALVVIEHKVSPG